MTDKILSLLGFASKAGKLSFGTHATEWAISSGKAKLVLAANDISERSVKELKFKASDKIPVKVLLEIDIDTLSKKVGKSCGIVAVNDDGFASALLNEMN